MTTLEQAFIKELSDIYAAEKQITEALPKMAEEAHHDELRQAFETHLEETRGQIDRLNRAFDILGEQPESTTCEVLASMVSEAEELMNEIQTPEVRDAIMIGAAQKVEHYEIASYGTLREFATCLGQDEVATLLNETLEEESNTDEKLNQLALQKINDAALQAGDNA